MTTTDEPERLDIRSHDIAADKIDELLRLFPEARTEGGQIDFERLKLVLGESIDVGKERYGLTWPGKAACFKTIQTPSLGTLLPAKDQSVNWDATENLIIEGDNLEVLKLLQKSYLGKVKMIYIDPPYNTGNDFIYPDDYAESLKTYLEYTGQVDEAGRRFSTNTDTDGRFHSKWLTMMYPRLYLARNLLRDDGVIFISIDDGEIKNLRALCDEIFGEEEFLASLARITKRSSNAGTHFSPSKDYVVCYARERTLLSSFSVALTEEQIASFNKTDERGRYKEIGLYQAALKHGGSVYPIQCPDGSEVRPPGTVPWRWNRQTFLGGLAAGLIVFKQTTKSPLIDAATGVRSDWNVYTKLYLDQRLEAGLVPKDFIEDIQNTLATRELSDLGIDYDFPKPTKLVAYLANLMRTGPDDIVLDFFAGSGTTAHAVLDLNRKAAGNRKFILVQLPEPTERNDYATIADITKERVRRVIAKLNTDDGDGAATQDRGFRVFTLAESNIAAWDGAMAHDVATLTGQLELHVDHVRDDRSSDDVLYEILLKSGFPLSTAVGSIEVEGTTVASVASGALLICLAQDVSLELVRAIAANQPERAVFLDEGFAGNDALKANAAQIFKAAKVTFRTV